VRTWDIIGNRRWGYLLSLVVIIPGIIAIAAWGINLGIDFTGGTLLDLRLGREARLDEVRAALRPFGHEDAQIQLSSDRPRQVLIRTRPIDEEQAARLRAAFAREFGGVEVLRAERVGPKIGRELQARAIQAVVIGLLLQILYIAWRFRSIRFALAADIALLHDLVIVIGVFALARKEVDSAFVAVLLTVVGYSINDTVVILDRIREGLNLRTREPFPRLVNRSILEVLVRSVTTGFGAIIALLIIYFFGGPTIRDFIMGLGVGVITGTYSSIFVASPILVEWHNWSERRHGRPAPESGETLQSLPALAASESNPAGSPRRRRSRRRR
jgi:preprotein translocase subunit SecF